MDFETHDQNLIDELQSEKEELEAEITALRARLAEVEGALREIVDCVTLPAQNDFEMREIARKALEGEE